MKLVKTVIIHSAAAATDRLIAAKVKGGVQVGSIALLELLPSLLIAAKVKGGVQVGSIALLELLPPLLLLLLKGLTIVGGQIVRRVQ
jgi:ribosomal protein S28E/S33